MPVFVPLGRITDNPFNTRSHYDADAVAELADSIERDGMLQTPLARVVSRLGSAIGDVTEDARQLYAGEPFRDGPAADRLAHCGWSAQLAYGHTRARAWRLAWERQAERVGEQLPDALPSGLRGVPEGTMPVELRPLADDAMERMAWEENERRRDLDPVDRAAAIAARIGRHGWTHDEAGEALGLDRSTVSNILRWYEVFSADETGAGESALDAMRVGLISETKARALVSAFALAQEHPAHYEALRENGSVGSLFDHVSEAECADVSAADLRFKLKVERGIYEREVEAERRRREPEMFDFGKPAAEAPPDIDPVDAGIFAEARRIASDHSAAIGWITDAAQVRSASLDLLERTEKALAPVERAARMLHEVRAERQGTKEAQARTARLLGEIQFDVGRIEQELARRNDAEPYDDGGARLAAIVGTVGEEMGVAPLPEIDEDPATTERTAEATGDPVESVEGDTLDERTEAEREADWQALDVAVTDIVEAALLATDPAFHNLLSQVVTLPGAFDDFRDEMAAAFVGQIAAGFTDPRSAAEAWGVAVEWPDVSADTLPAGDHGTAVYEFAACPKRLFRAPEPWGLRPLSDSVEAGEPVDAVFCTNGATVPQPVRLGDDVDPQRWADKKMPPGKPGIYPGWRLAIAATHAELEELYKGRPVPVAIRRDVSDLEPAPSMVERARMETAPAAEPSGRVSEAGVTAPGRDGLASGGTSSPEDSACEETTTDDALTTGAEDELHASAHEQHAGEPGPEPYSVRAMAFEGVATIKSQLGNGTVDLGVERFLEVGGHTWAVAPRLGAGAPDAGPIRWNVMLVATGVGLSISAETPEQAEDEARATLKKQGPEKIAEVVRYSLERYGEVNPGYVLASGDGAAQPAPEVAEPHA